MPNVLSAFVGRERGGIPRLIECATENGVHILCVQEVMSSEVPILIKEFSFVRYVPMTEFPNGTTMGLATCTNLPVTGVHEDYYVGDATVLPSFDEATPEQINATKIRPLLICTIKDGNESFRVGNTHFLYSKDGTPQEEHRQALRSLMFAAEDAGHMLLCGAMVMPRDGELYKKLFASPVFRDLVPRTITCTLDPNLHKHAELLKNGVIPTVVVDYGIGVGFRPTYGPSEVRQFTNICAHTPLLFKF